MRRSTLIHVLHYIPVLCQQVSYFSKLRLLRTYILPAAPLGLYRHGLYKGDVREALDRETNCIIMRWLETSNPPVARAVADVLIRSPQ